MKPRFRPMSFALRVNDHQTRMGGEALKIPIIDPTKGLLEGKKYIGCTIAHPGMRAYPEQPVSYMDRGARVSGA